MALGRIGSLLAIASLAAVMIFGAWPGGAQAAPYAGIVMDMRSGAVYYEHDADRKQHPASLTKMMTLYLTFEAIQRGQIGLDQRVRVSSHAARQPASKLYLKAGQRVKVRDLIRATAIKSANDAAMVLAETVGGSQKRFGQMMTAKARQLGMTGSTFKNPHGLTQRGHLSTARDMAKLARHLYFDFPQFYNVFGRKTHVAAGKRIRTTNRLLATYRGAEGMKTGYTRAAGYNLVSVAARGQERVIAVVMGGKSSRSRNAQSRKLLDLGFAKAPTRVAMRKPSKGGGKKVNVARAPYPRPRPGTGATGFTAVAQAIATPAVAATGPMSTSRMAPLYSDYPPLRDGIGLATGDWAVELAGFEDESAAIRTLASVTLAGIDAVETAQTRIAKSGSGTAKSWKLRFDGLDRDGAMRACAALEGFDGTCTRVALK